MTNSKSNAHKSRNNPTTSEGILWSILRAKQLNGLKFRRQHPIEPWIVDFACVARQLVVEIDGGYHDGVQAEDLRRQGDLERRGWTVLRFTDEEVERDAAAVAMAIAAQVGVAYQFKARQRTGAGMRNINARKPKPK